MKKKRKNLYKECLHNRSYSTFIVYYILFTDFFRKIFYWSRKSLFDLTLTILVFRRWRPVLQKRSNLSWWTSTFRPASPQTEGKLLYLRFASLPEQICCRSKGIKEYYILLQFSGHIF